MTFRPSRFSSALFRLGASLASLLLFSAPAFAGEAPPSGPAAALFRWLNFAIIFAVVAWLMVRKAGPAFRAHAEGIADSIADSRRAREAAEEHQHEAERKLATLDAEIARLRQAALEDASAEELRLRSLAGRETDRIRKAAQDEIHAAQRASHLELKRIAARLAVLRAGEILHNHLTKEADAGLFRSFLAGLDHGAR